MKTSNKVLWGILGTLFIVILLAIIATRLGACSTTNMLFTHKVRGNGVISIQKNSVQDFDVIKISAPGKVIVNKGSQNQLTIKYDQNLMPYLKTYIQDGTLYITQRSKITLNPKASPMFTITMNKGLTALKSAGANKVIINNINPEQFSLNISGFGVAYIQNGTTKLLKLGVSGLGKIVAHKIAADNVNLNISGAGKSQLSGKTDNLKINISGSGKIAAKQLITQNADVDISGLGKAVINVTNRLNANIAGTGSIDYYGNPKKIQQKLGGTGKITQIK